ncbi:hypothetical protein BDZ97DRAFT_1828792 [Flammula alnicola]|nr:hypothetical protein BDZ97DRAFT_1828792 [Flammula alnicola]
MIQNDPIIVYFVDIESKSAPEHDRRPITVVLFRTVDALTPDCDRELIDPTAACQTMWHFYPRVLLHLFASKIPQTLCTGLSIFKASSLYFPSISDGDGNPSLVNGYFSTEISKH